MDQAQIIRALGPEHVADVIKNVNRICIEVNSEERLDVVLALTRCKPASVFWPVFLQNWSHCDDTWHARDRLLLELRRHSAETSGTAYLDQDARGFLDGLPDPVPVFRGCSASRALGVSWTTRHDVAAGFAVGHRGIHVPSPVVVSGLVPKSGVFAAFQGRNESELVLDPETVTGRKVADCR